MITFEAVSKAFGDDSFALQDISFTIHPGELVVITGHSGSGKTTLMKLLTKEYEPTDGEIYFEEQALSQIKKNRVHHHRRKIGVVFQDYKLIPDLNVWENIALALQIIGQKQSEIEQRVTDLLHLISLENKAFLFPSQLSGGEAQRVSIARALATAPRLIFADEPTGNLDTQTSQSIARLLQKINKLGTTVMVATHDVSVLDMLSRERHIQLQQGKLTKDSGSHSPKIKKSSPSHSPVAEPASTSPTPPVTTDSHPVLDKTEPAPHQPEIEVEDLDQEPHQNAEEKHPHKSGFSLRLPHLGLPFGKKNRPITTEVKSPDSTHKTITEPDTEPTPKTEVKVESL